MVKSDGVSSSTVSLNEEWHGYGCTDLLSVRSRMHGCFQVYGCLGDHGPMARALSRSSSTVGLSVGSRCKQDLMRSSKSSE